MVAINNKRKIVKWDERKKKYVRTTVGESNKKRSELSGTKSKKPGVGKCYTGTSTVHFSCFRLRIQIHMLCSAMHDIDIYMYNIVIIHVSLCGYLFHDS
jgi:hypothetical protein